MLKHETRAKPGRPHDFCGEVAQLVRASDCRSEGCEIVPRPSRHFMRVRKMRVTTTSYVIVFHVSAHTIWFSAKTLNEKSPTES